MEVTIRSYKCIKKPITFTIKPLTLLYGPNGAGKSTVIHAFIAAQDDILYRLPADLDMDINGIRVCEENYETLRETLTGLKCWTPRIIKHNRLEHIKDLIAAAGKYNFFNQPDAFMHPRMQLDMAEVFIEASKTNNYFIETHSEHLILRILRRIGEGTLDKDNVQVYYLDTDGYLIDLKINDDGEFDTHWPEGFFNERFEELFFECTA